ncbi:EAL domain-containing protein [Simiduia aestuariiviva]|uniref:Diguanylate cyclase (GGDEF)-like protein n=1 Tax=Simiduia aestuariiviva TaxID=1510459 RepID=A0A839UQL8_9GAMM|nr:EAL domain-containing protein [Simiduia aestuariiviva]MBB3167838.1 diguanylate cyclase (GGDEF)-like protein [Simiduia aestuariiviva]
MADANISLERQLHNLRIVSDFAIGMLSLTSLEQVVWFLARDVIAKIGFSDVVVYLYEPDTKTLVQKAAFGLKSPEAYTILDPKAIPLGQGVVGKAAESRCAQLIADTRTYPGYIHDVGAGLSELAVPMLSAGQLVGVIDSEHPETNFYTQDHLETVSAVASIAATKIIQTQTVTSLQLAIEDLEYSSKIQTVLFEMAELIFHTDSLPEFYRLMHRSISRLTFSKNFYVALLDPSNAQVIIPYRVDQRDGDETGEIIPFDLDKPSLTAFALAGTEPLLLCSEDLQQLIEGNKIEVLGTLPTSWLGVPFGEGAVRGLVAVQSYDGGYDFGPKDKQLLMYVSKHIRNAIERFQSRVDLNFLALHDPLTHLPNRNLFADRLGQAVAKAERDEGYELAVMYLDLDHFKRVNDTHGHAMGDKLLMQLAGALAGCMRKMDTLARFGGDEFAVLLEGPESWQAARRVGADMINVVRNNQIIDDVRVNVSASIGVSLYQSGQSSIERLMSEADEAMYQAKLLGRDQIQVYSTAGAQKYSATHRLDRDFKRAIAQGEFYLVLQPVVSLDGGQMVAVEALVRWNHADHGELSPASFISDLEKSGQIVDLDIWVFGQALLLLKKFQSQTFVLNINISGQGLINADLLKVVRKARQIHGDQLSRLCVEVTESSLVDDVELAQSALRELQSFNISLAIDDFGTGYSSLSYLHKFSFDRLKIDRAFIVGLETSQEKAVILNTIVSLARALGIQTVAEGIEEIKQFELLAELGCDFGQGFLMSRPVAQNVLVKMLADDWRY